MANGENNDYWIRRQPNQCFCLIFNLGKVRIFSRFLMLYFLKTNQFQFLSYFSRITNRNLNLELSNWNFLVKMETNI